MDDLLPQQEINYFVGDERPEKRVGLIEVCLYYAILFRARYV